MRSIRLAVGLVLVAFGGLVRTASGDDSKVRDVPYLRGLAEHWKARFDSRIEPTLLAIDPTRPLPRLEPVSVPTDPDGPQGPWELPVTDVLAITAGDEFPAILDAFSKRLDDRAAKHDDFVVEHGWAGTFNSDARLFYPAIDRVRGARVVFAWGTRHGKKQGPFQLDYDHDCRLLGIPLIAVERTDLAAFVADVGRYLRLLTLTTVSADVWDGVRAIAHSEIRYAAVRDILYESYGRGLGSAPVEVRQAFARELAVAARESARNRLQAFCFVEFHDRVPDVIAAVLGDDLRWLVDVVKGEEPLAAVALSVAGRKETAFVARAIGVDLVLAGVDRARGLQSYEIRIALSVLDASTPRRVSVERVRSILRALTGADGRTWTTGGIREHCAQLLVALTRVLPDLVGRFSELPDADRAAVREWLRSLRVWAPPLEEPIRKARELFGA